MLGPVTDGLEEHLIFFQQEAQYLAVPKHLRGKDPGETPKLEKRIRVQPAAPIPRLNQPLWLRLYGALLLQPGGQLSKWIP